MDNGVCDASKDNLLTHKHTYNIKTGLCECGKQYEVKKPPRPKGKKKMIDIKEFEKQAKRVREIFEEEKEFAKGEEKNNRSRE